VPLAPPIQKSAVLCTQPSAGEHHTKKAGDGRRQAAEMASKTRHTPKRHADTRACPPHPHYNLLRTASVHAHPLLPTAMAFVPYGFVLVQASSSSMVAGRGV
jgi:hypothetical protein